MKAFTFAIAVSFVFALSLRCYGQQDSLFVAGQALRIGMSQSDVLSRLEHYKVQQVPTAGEKLKETDPWIIEENNGARKVGTVQFFGGKLTFATKDWTSPTTDEGSFGKLLVALLENLNAEGNSNAVITAKTVSRQPDRTLHSISFKFPGKSVSIYVTERPATGKCDIQMDELLER